MNIKFFWIVKKNIAISALQIIAKVKHIKGNEMQIINAHNYACKFIDTCI